MNPKTLLLLLIRGFVPVDADGAFHRPLLWARPLRYALPNLACFAVGLIAHHLFTGPFGFAGVCVAAIFGPMLFASLVALVFGAFGFSYRE